MGCADIRLTNRRHPDGGVCPVTPEDRDAGRSVKVRSRIDGTTLYLQTNQGCDLGGDGGSSHTIEERGPRTRISPRSSPCFGLGYAAPHHRHRSCSRTPPTSTRTTATPAISTTQRGTHRGLRLGAPSSPPWAASWRLVPIIELMRVAAAGEERETTSTRQGRVVETRCAV